MRTYVPADMALSSHCALPSSEEARILVHRSVIRSPSLLCDKSLRLHCGNQAMFDE